MGARTKRAQFTFYNLTLSVSGVADRHFYWWGEHTPTILNCDTISTLRLKCECNIPISSRTEGGPLACAFCLRSQSGPRHGAEWRTYDDVRSSPVLIFGGLRSFRWSRGNARSLVRARDGSRQAETAFQRARFTTARPGPPYGSGGSQVSSDSSHSEPSTHDNADRRPLGNPHSKSFQPRFFLPYFRSMRRAALKPLSGIFMPSPCAI